MGQRLTTYFLLWLLYVSYILLRRMSATGQTNTLSAVLSIFAAANVPITYMSIRWWRTQHPGPVLTSGQVDPSMRPAVWWNLAGWFLWSALLLVMRYRLEQARQRAHSMREEALLAELSGPPVEAQRSPEVSVGY